jgi:hypothetical protein
MKLPEGAIPVIWEGEELSKSAFCHFSFDESHFLTRLCESLPDI